MDKLDFLKIDSPDSFEELCLEIFRYQAEKVSIYKEYVSYLGIDPKEVKRIEQIPFLPIDFFKSHKIISEDVKTEVIFSSSGTTGQTQSKHHVGDLSIYEKSFKAAFNRFYANVSDYCILALLPNYLEREGSSLVYMAQQLIDDSKHHKSGFYLHNHDELVQVLSSPELKEQKVILLGVTFALLDLAEKYSISKDQLIVMETGGMKGQRKELVRDELHKLLCEKLNVDSIHSEYGMTELLSQAYSKGNGRFYCPPWMKVLIRDTNDPLTLVGNEQTGGMNIIDLANVYSCSFIMTQDLGKSYADGSFEVLGRFDSSDIRGCNLMVLIRTY